MVLRVTAFGLSLSLACVALVTCGACGNEHWTFDDPAPADAARVDAGIDSSAPNCAEGETACADHCVNVASSKNNCGACGTICGEGLVCDVGVCHPACRAGRVECNGGCIDIASDDRGCGGCGVQCEAPAKCRGGVCR